MQISRHWRLNAQRYRLEGVRYENGETSLQRRPVMGDTEETDTEAIEVVEDQERTINAA